jgi:hypothetical protein
MQFQKKNNNNNNIINVNNVLSFAKKKLININMSSICIYEEGLRSPIDAVLSSQIF